MGSHVIRKQMVQWMWRWSVSPVVVNRGHMPFCSVQKEPRPLDSSQTDQITNSPVNHLTLSSLLDMGFSQTQAEEMYEGAAKSHGKHVPSVLTTLFILGFNTFTILKIMQKCPAIYLAKGVDLQQRIDNLRKLGFVEGSLQRLISHYPKIMVLPVKKVNTMSRMLKEKCLFTTQQVTDILRNSTEVLEDDLALLEYKFQYAYIHMGAKQADMVKANLFSMPLFELRCRHCFLERRGLYQTPDKKGQTLILNPLLKNILCSSEETFLKQVAISNAEEFGVFCKLIEREIEEEDIDDDDDDDNGDDDDDDDDDDGKHRKKPHWNTGYKRDHKKGFKYTSNEITKK